MTLTAPSPEVISEQDAQALFKEARMRRRRRWLVGAIVLAVVATAMGLAIA